MELNPRTLESKSRTPPGSFFRDITLSYLKGSSVCVCVCVCVFVCVFRMCMYNHAFKEKTNEYRKSCISFPHID